MRCFLVPGNAFTLIVPNYRELKFHHVCNRAMGILSGLAAYSTDFLLCSYLLLFVRCHEWADPQGHSSGCLILRLNDFEGRLPRFTYLCLDYLARATACAAWDDNALLFFCDLSSLGAHLKPVKPGGTEITDSWLVVFGQN